MRGGRPVIEGTAVGVDVGGTTIKAGLVTSDGTLRHPRRTPTSAGQGAGAVVAAIRRVTGELVDAAARDRIPLRGVGLVTPGVIDEARGMVVWAANLGFRDAPVADQVAAELDLPVVLGHDVRAGGVAEARLGAGRDARHLLFLAIGTGIAAAQVVDGRAVAGAHGAAGELGHVQVRAGPPCGCGGQGCLEAVASATAVGRRYAQLVGDAGAADTPDAGRVAAAVTAGDETAALVWRDAVAALADGIVIGQALVDAEVIVIGGGLAAAGETLLAPLRTAVKERLTFHRMPQLAPAALGDNAGCLGAGLLALDRLAR